MPTPGSGWALLASRVFLANPDARVVLVKEYAKKHFKNTEVLDFALGVEQITTQKRDTLILNVDGAIAVGFVDMLRSCGAFTREEADELIENGCLNGLFVLGRSIGFIGHFLDQKRLKQPLYRHPTICEFSFECLSAWVWVGGLMGFWCVCGLMFPDFAAYLRSLFSYFPTPHTQPARTCRSSAKRGVWARQVQGGVHGDCTVGWRFRKERGRKA